jgi:predicted DCC family thiol-disulfide oxidoreductase YuxK
MSTPTKNAELIVVYDGECPFCSRYVRLLKLREAVGRIRLINARDGGPVAIALHKAGYDLNEGMVALYGGQTYHGADCINVLAFLSTGSGVFNCLNSFIFRSKHLSRALYPILRLGRAATLKMLGKSQITDET